MWPKKYDDLVTFPTHCEKQQKEIHSKEKNSEHIAVNIDNDFVRQIKIDGDVFERENTTERRIDYLVIDETKKTAYLIELKGSHVKSAFNQIEYSHEQLRNALQGYKIYWRVVCGSRTANLRTNDIKIYLKMNPQLILKRNVLTEKI